MNILNKYCCFVQFAVMLAVVLVMFAASGCRGDHELLMNDLCKYTGKVTDTLKMIDNVGTAKKLKPRLSYFVSKLVVLKKRSRDLGPPTPSQEARLRNLFQEKIRTSQQNLMSELVRVSAIPGVAKILGDTFKKIK